MIPSKNEVARLLPIYRGELDIYKLDQDTPDIIAAIAELHEQEKKTTIKSLTFLMRRAQRR